MITEIPLNEPHIFAFQISGKLVEDDYATFRPKLDKLLEEESPLSLLIQLKEFDGWSAKSAWEDLKTGINHDESFLRIAIVGKSLWEKVMSEFGNLFLDTKVRYFEDEALALDWLNQVKNIAEQNEYIGYRNILVASDFSKYSEMALKKAVEVAKPFNAKITLIHAAEIISSEMYPSIGELAVPVMVDNPELEEKNLRKIEAQLDKVVAKMGYPEDLIQTEIVSGHPVNTIIEYATENDADLIVMGSHGRRGLARLLGSSTNGVINHAPCDVLTVV